MLYQFDCEKLKHAQAALILYALYKSRNSNSAINGVETWDRFNAYVRGACLKSNTTAEFVQNFCRKAKIESIKPRYLDTGEPVFMPDTGEAIVSDEIKDYQTKLLENNELLDTIAAESLYLIMLVRERIQREKIYQTEDENED